MDTMADRNPMEKSPAIPLAGLDPADLLRQGAAEDTIAADAGGRFDPPAVEELAPLFPQFEILELIGKGGMGAVYKARQRELERIVALKILPPGIGGTAGFPDRFAREAKALAKLNHPGIVTIHEFGQRDGLCFIVMEHVDGVNLRQLMQTGRISPREALAIVPQICDALQFAHDRGIVHRDIKPENILLDRLGRVKVADFGLAKLVGGEDLPETAETLAGTDFTEVGKVMGTPAYMAPEQLENPLEVDHRADIYALGVVFYQMLTGELPGKDLQPPSRKVRIDVRLDEIVLQALEQKPEQRFQQASVMKTRVEAADLDASDPPRKAGAERKPASAWKWLVLPNAVVIALLVFWLAGPVKWETGVKSRGTETQVLVKKPSAPPAADEKVSTSPVEPRFADDSRAQDGIESPPTVPETSLSATVSAPSVAPGDEKLLAQLIADEMRRDQVANEFVSLWQDVVAMETSGLGAVHPSRRIAVEALENFKRLHPDLPDARCVVLVKDRREALALRIKVSPVAGLGEKHPSITPLQAQLAAFDRFLSENGAGPSPMVSQQTSTSGTTDPPSGKLHLSAVIQADGTVSHDGEEITLPVFEEKLRDLVLQKKSLSLQLLASPQIPYRLVTEVLDVCRQAGVSDISFAPENERTLTVGTSSAATGETKIEDGQKQPVPEEAADKEKQAPALQWLAIVDLGKYSEAYRQSAKIVMTSATEEQWVGLMERFRKPLGALVTRKLLKLEETKSLPGAPDGEYRVMQFSAGFAEKKEAVETLALRKEEDGTWKSCGYFIR